MAEWNIPAEKAHALAGALAKEESKWASRKNLLQGLAGDATMGVLAVSALALIPMATVTALAIPAAVAAGVGAYLVGHAGFYAADMKRVAKEAREGVESGLGKVGQAQPVGFQLNTYSDVGVGPELALAKVMKNLGAKRVGGWVGEEAVFEPKTPVAKAKSWIKSKGF